MSGHSKWAQIKRQKGAADIKRGQIFTKLANGIIIAVRQGGGVADPEANFKLRLAVDRARSFNMPKENIERAISRAKGKSGGVELSEVVYEGFAPGGVAVIVEAVTDNKQRTAAEIKNTFEKSGGTLGTPGAVSYQFKQEGCITIKKDGKSLDDILLIAADAGAEDVEDSDDTACIYTQPQELQHVKEELLEKSFAVSDAELTRRALNTVPISDRATAEKTLSFMEKIEELDDVQKVYSNFDIPDDLLKQIKTTS